MTACEWVEPFWKSGRMIDESVLFTLRPGDAAARARLAFVPRKILAVETASKERRFEMERDFTWEAGGREIRVTAHSGITFRTQEQLYLPKGSQPIGAGRDGKCDLLFSEGSFFHGLQTVVTYEHAGDDWPAPASLSERFSLPRISRIFDERKPLRVVVLGDSISTGANASGNSRTPPLQPAYPQLIAEAVRERFGCAVELVNLSVGGKNSVWGCEQLPRAVAERPDLAILAFGMNDAAKLTSAEYLANMHTQVQTLRRDVPGVDIVLVATMTGNPEWVGSSPALYPEYRDGLWKMRGPGVAVADVTSVWEILAARKSYLDLTGNGLNHPNDFGHRIYAQVIWSLLTNLR